MRASHPCDFAPLAVAVWSLGSRGRFVSRIPSARERCVLAVEWAAYAKAAAIEDVGVDRSYFAMAEQLLDGADVVAVLTARWLETPTASSIREMRSTRMSRLSRAPNPG